MCDLSVRLHEMISQTSVPVFVTSNGWSLSVVATVVFIWGFSPLWSSMGWEINYSGIRHPNICMRLCIGGFIFGRKYLFVEGRDLSCFQTPKGTLPKGKNIWGVEQPSLVAKVTTWKVWNQSLCCQVLGEAGADKQKPPWDQSGTTVP